MGERDKQELTPVVTGQVAESLALMRVAEGLYNSGLFPNAKSPAGAFAIVQYGHELGIPPMVSLQNINIVSGKPCVNGQIMLSKAISAGVTYEVLSETLEGCSIRFKRGETTYTATFDKADATAAGLLGKDNWRKFPKDMYFWRAVAKGVRRIAPESIMGLYLPDEIHPDGARPEVREPIETTGEVITPESPKESGEKEPPTQGVGLKTAYTLDQIRNMVPGDQMKVLLSKTKRILTETANKELARVFTNQKIGDAFLLDLVDKQILSSPAVDENDPEQIARLICETWVIAKKQEASHATA